MDAVPGVSQKALSRTVPRLELVANPTAAIAIAEANVVGSKQARSTRQFAPHYIPYTTSTDVVDLRVTVCNRRVQCITFGKIQITLPDKVSNGQRCNC